MIVDGSIVMVENTIRKLSHNDNPEISTFKIVQESLKEMARPIFFGVLIITVVYMPILSLEGMEYKMFSPMVFTVCFALLGSLLIALILVPVLCSFFLKGKIIEKDNILIEKIKQPYLKLLDKALNNRKKTVTIAAAAFIISVASLAFIGTEFVPKLDEGSFSIGVANLPSISLSEAVKVTTRIENAIKDVPEVKSVVSKIGRADLATDPMGVYQTDTFVELNPKSRWRFGMSKDKLAEELDDILQEKVPGVNFSFTQPIEMRVNELVSGVKADIAVKIFGDDLDILVKKAEQIEKVLQTVKGQEDLQVEQISGTQQVTIVPDRIRMARYGVSISDVRDIISTAIMGEPVSEILDGKKRFTLRVKFPEGSNIDPAMVGNLLVEAKDGRRISIFQIAKVRVEEGLEVVNREFGQRRIIIQCNVRGRDIGTFVKEAQEKIDKQVKLPANYYIEWGGQFENQQRAMSKLALVVPVSILIIFFLLMATFSSIKHSLLVIMNVPFAMVGGILALWIREMYLSVPASIGFIALFGVAILNGLVLISYFNKLLDDGMEMKEAILKGVEVRLRPVLMTALVATLGFLPMALSTGSGAEVQKPLATVVIGGLITSTVLTLIVLPVLYSWFCHPETKIRKKIKRVFKELILTNR
jgi:cobalt-zinc-cadmium resistance protein CzcA